MDKVVVTGGAGYVGSHVCKALAAAGMLPVSVDNLSTGHAWAVKWGPLEQGDLRNSEFLAGVFACHRPVAVLHLADLSQIAQSVADPGLYYDNNVVGTLNLLNAMRRAGIARIVHSSSASVYGDGVVGHPVAEDTPLAPISPYGAGKAMVERVLDDHSRAYGLSSVSLRFYNVAGADAEVECGEAHDPETHLIPLAIRAALGGAPLRIFGSDHPTADGTAVRDYVHVVDLAEAHLLALGLAVRDGLRETINLGSGCGHSVRTVVDTVERIGGRKVPFEWSLRRPGDPSTLVADIGRAKRVLDWWPRRSLDDMVASAWAWHAR